MSPSKAAAPKAARAGPSRRATRPVGSIKEKRGMKCECCANPATVHLTDIVDGQKKVVHLCDACAEQQQFVKNNDLNVPAIVQSVISHYLGQEADELARLTCPACGVKYME